MSFQTKVAVEQGPQLQRWIIRARTALVRLSLSRCMRSSTHDCREQEVLFCQQDPRFVQSLVSSADPMPPSQQDVGTIDDHEYWQRRWQLMKASVAQPLHLRGRRRFVDGAMRTRHVSADRSSAMIISWAAKVWWRGILVKQWGRWHIKKLFAGRNAKD